VYYQHYHSLADTSYFFNRSLAHTLTYLSLFFSFFANMSSLEEGNPNAQRSITSSGRPSDTFSSNDINPFDPPSLPSGVQTPGSNVSRPYTMKIDENSRYRAVRTLVEQYSELY
jgi:hypothetical protein